ncbi:MAG: hypothetical protein H6R02_3150 [Burkholderiaceae bacterium]|nr:hypothetical protein [Burkholderiaceae bacterium]
MLALGALAKLLLCADQIPGLIGGIAFRELGVAVRHDLQPRAMGGSDQQGEPRHQQQPKRPGKYPWPDARMHHGASGAAASSASLGLTKKRARKMPSS